MHTHSISWDALKFIKNGNKGNEFVTCEKKMDGKAEEKESEETKEEKEKD